MFCDVPQELSKRLGKLIQGEMDEYNRGVIFTPAFVARHKARIRGLFSAITRSTWLMHFTHQALCKIHSYNRFVPVLVLQQLPAVTNFLSKEMTTFMNNFFIVIS